jgi:transcriptional regulator with XRE-family HTH domain
MLGMRIRELRDGQGYSQAQLADLLSEKTGKQISKAAVGAYERESSDLSTAMLAAMADIFQVSMESVLGRADHVADAKVEYGNDDLDDAIVAILRARTLPSSEKSRIIAVLKAGWPDLFGGE